MTQLGLDDRIRPVATDFANIDEPAASFDLVWSEGALYNVGMTDGLKICRNLLRPGGHLVFTDAVWQTDAPPPEVKELFDAEYPTMGRATDVADSIARAGFTLIDHFTLPDEAWWDDFYTPMLRRIDELRSRHQGDAEALATLDELAAEPTMHEANSKHYAYEFFVARLPETP